MLADRPSDRRRLSGGWSPVSLTVRPTSNVESSEGGLSRKRSATSPSDHCRKASAANTSTPGVPGSRSDPEPSAPAAQTRRRDLAARATASRDQVRFSACSSGLTARLEAVASSRSRQRCARLLNAVTTVDVMRFDPWPTAAQLASRRHGHHRRRTQTAGDGIRTGPPTLPDRRTTGRFRVVVAAGQSTCAAGRPRRPGRGG